MSDQPPSGSTEPVPPASSGPPADPTRSTSPAHEPASTPGHVGEPATPGQSTPTAPGVPAQPTAGHPAAPAQPGQPGYGVPGQPGYGVPGQPGYGVPGQPGYGVSGGQPWGTYSTDPAGPAPGWVWPAAGGPVPAGAWPGAPMPGQPYGWYPGADPGDPLVTPPHAGIGGWFARCSGAVQRGWRQLLPIMLLTQTLPAAVISVLTLVLVPAVEPTTAPDGAPVLPDGYFQDIFALYGLILLAALIFGPLQSAGWAAGTWVVARQAAGEPVGVGAALRYGWRRALGVWGWTIVATLLISVGFCLCVLPGIYAAFAVALFGPVYLFERQEPIGRAFRMFHQRFGMVLGRVALVAAAVIVGSLVGGIIEGVGQLPFGVDPMSAPGTAAGAVAVSLVAAVLVTPVYLAQLVGVVVTYAEQRAQEGPVNAARLAAELG
ncbi:hypothetical protein ONA91_00830 [Micromonospora sp. DR5-3]|uniref:hypothetical protein n=1 Tax=unclassified Micromonospora TaxID=2617518 RepID=UPI0011DC1CA7|nr:MULTISPECIES: hypothetical protein [unclassified Micromonospora]MCW3813002.1 hypothetical protein [Micromonospora sp. DR5-3]TYC26004.1 hypothetical protein FXF52_01140 [Micromonospora sp. MP36]